MRIRRNLSNEESRRFWESWPDGELEEDLTHLLGADWWNAERELSVALLRGEEDKNE